MAAPEIITFGCRLNAFKSEIIRRAAGEAGLGDAVIVNTSPSPPRPSVRPARRSAAPAASVLRRGSSLPAAPRR